MHVMKRAVKALCVATSFPWCAVISVDASAAAAGRSITRGTIGRTFLQSTILKSSSFSSVAFAHKSISSSTSKLNHQRSAITKLSAKMSGSANNIQQTKNRVALLQLPVTSDKAKNIQTAKEYIEKADEAGAQLCVLPEIWNSPYATSAFPEYAETLPKVGDSLSSQDDNENKSWGESSIMLMELARSTNMYIVGGSIPEKCLDKIYNTCLIVNPSGKIVGKHRKVHLFDINVPGGVRFQESETLTGGEEATYFDVEGEDDGDNESGLGRIGVGICYDIRFPEYALLLTQKHQCKVLIYPGAFNLTTGPAHWELLARGRAVDGQCFVLTASPARMPPPKEDDGNKSKYPHYSAWGHSTVVSPWGEVVATCDENPAMVVADLDMEKVNEMRMAIPTMVQKRHDLYRLVDVSDAKE